MTDYFNQLTAGACPIPRSGFRSMPVTGCMALARDCFDGRILWIFIPVLRCTKKSGMKYSRFLYYI